MLNDVCQSKYEKLISRAIFTNRYEVIFQHPNQSKNWQYDSVSVVQTVYGSHDVLG